MSGTVANNFRQGYRAEYFAKYAISEFGPCERILPENDFGIDLLAALMERNKMMGMVSRLYGIQIKSGKEPFQYKGSNISGWLKAFNIPILMCRVNRNEGRIQLFTTWNLHVFFFTYKDVDIEKLTFLEDWGDTDQISPKLATPSYDTNTKEATINIGKPIIDFKIEDLADTNKTERFERVLRFWVEEDASNYFKRLIHLNTVLGHLYWETNTVPGESFARWYRPYAYGDESTKDALNILKECGTIIALGNNGKTSPLMTKLKELMNEIGNLDDFQKRVLEMQT